MVVACGKLSRGLLSSVFNERRTLFQVRFFYHQKVRSASLGLYVVKVTPLGNITDRIWWVYGDQSDIWNNDAVVLSVPYR